MNISELRKQQYEYNTGRGAVLGGFPFVDDWKRNPYTFIKTRFYIEISSVLVYFFLKLKIKPNTITILYISCGVVGCVLLAIPYKINVYIALFIFVFLRSTLDNCDGHVARLTNSQSFKGAILDDYGAQINSLGFWTGLGFYSGHLSSMMIFYYLVPLLLFFYAADLYMYASLQIIQNAAMNKEDILSVKNLNSESGIRSKYRLIRGIIYFYEKLVNILRDSFPDDRARTYDLVCLLIFLELNGGVFLSWTIFVVFLFKKLILFTYSVYAIMNKNWIENVINKIWHSHNE